VRSLDDFMATFDAHELHSLAIAAPAGRVDRAVREVTLGEMPVARALLRLRGVGRGAGNARRPVVDAMLDEGVLLDDAPGEGLVLGLTGQFWRVRGGFPADRPRTADEFVSYSRPDVAKAVVDFRVVGLDASRSVLTTETRVRVPALEARKKFARYWRIVRPFSGLTRVMLLRAARARAEAPA
jgi:hypothetical protein